MKIFLIHSPYDNYSFPYPALPYLKGTLIQNGYQDVKTIDLNIDFLSYQVNKKHVLPETINYFNDPFNSKLHVIIKNSKQVWESIKNLNNTDILIEYYYTKVIPSIIAAAPSFIGFSITYPSQIFATFALIYLLRKNNYTRKICLGGSFLTKIYNRISKKSSYFQQYLFPLIDYIIFFEGELPLVKLIRTLDSTITKDSFNDIPNLMYRKSEKVIINQYYRFNKLDIIGTPDFDDYTLAAYQTNKLPLICTRGCYWKKCTFCSSHSIYKQYFKKHSVQKIIQDIKALTKKHNSSMIHFNDEAMPGKYLTKLSKRLIDEKIKISWSTNIRFDANLSLKDLRNAQRAGCTDLNIGLESGSQKVLNLMKKGISIPQIRKQLHNISKSGIHSNLYLIIGFPGETEADLNDTIIFLKENKRHWDTVAVHRFSLEEGSYIYTNTKNFGIEINENPNNDLIAYPAFKYKNVYDERQYLDSLNRKMEKINRINVNKKIRENDLFFNYSLSDKIIKNKKIVAESFKNHNSNFPNNIIFFSLKKDVRYPKFLILLNQKQHQVINSIDRILSVHDFLKLDYFFTPKKQKAAWQKDDVLKLIRQLLRWEIFIIKKRFSLLYLLNRM